MTHISPIASTSHELVSLNPQRERPGRSVACARVEGKGRAVQTYPVQLPFQQRWKSGFPFVAASLKAADLFCVLERLLALATSAGIITVDENRTGFCFQS